MQSTFRQAQFFMACIIFLTGCAKSEYYTRLGSSAAPNSLANLSNQQLFCWPVDGKVTALFGSREDGVTLKGIMVEPRRRADVVACRDGRVAFMDDAFGDYGKTVILEHAGHYATVYSGNTEILVVLGQWVRQGEVIARSTRANRGGRPFYFELRKNGKAENPLDYLTPKEKLNHV